MTATTPLIPRQVDPAHAPGETALDHEALLDLARQVRAAADSHDPEWFGQEAQRFLRELVAHLRSESHNLSQLPDDRRQELARSQQELVEMATALAHADPRCPGVSRARPARVLLGALQSQRSEEHRSLLEAGRGTGPEPQPQRTMNGRRPHG